MRVVLVSSLFMVHAAHRGSPTQPALRLTSSVSVSILLSSGALKTIQHESITVQAQLEPQPIFSSTFSLTKPIRR